MADCGFTIEKFTSTSTFSVFLLNKVKWKEVTLLKLALLYSILNERFVVLNTVWCDACFSCSFS